MTPRELALEIVLRLRRAGYEALWAGGCVRDQLLGREPQDYDVATSARPEEIRQLFGRRRTLAVGAAFGVITVLGPRPAGQIDVATFRSDEGYSDGRHPDRVRFSDARMDAQRRDFTINGLFYDPVAERVIDYVGGQRDLRAGRIRAIGDPAARINEDKLRMLRGVRFAATYDFTLEPATLRAIQRHAHQITIVSAERVAHEMRRMLVHRRRARAVELLAAAGLLAVVLPEAAEAFGDLAGGDTERENPAGRRWRITRGVLEHLTAPSFPAALAALLWQVCPRPPEARRIGDRWRLSRSESNEVTWLLEHYPTLLAARNTHWSVLQPLLTDPRVESLLELAQAVAEVRDGDASEIEYCRDKLELPPKELNPPPLVSGHDLIELGIPRGPHYKPLIDEVRRRQLDGELADRSAALEFVRRRWQSGG